MLSLPEEIVDHILTFFCGDRYLMCSASSLVFLYKLTSKHTSVRVAEIFKGILKLRGRNFGADGVLDAYVDEFRLIPMYYGTRKEMTRVGCTQIHLSLQHYLSFSFTVSQTNVTLRTFRFMRDDISLNISYRKMIDIIICFYSVLKQVPDHLDFNDGMIEISTPRSAPKVNRRKANTTVGTNTTTWETSFVKRALIEDIFHCLYYDCLKVLPTKKSHQADPDFSMAADVMDYLRTQLEGQNE